MATQYGYQWHTDHTLRTEHSTVCLDEEVRIQCFSVVGFLKQELVLSRLWVVFVFVFLPKLREQGSFYLYRKNARF